MRAPPLNAITPPFPPLPPPSPPPQNAINISFMSVSRVAKGTEAIMAIGVDSMPSAEARLLPPRLLRCVAWAGGLPAGSRRRRLRALRSLPPPLTPGPPPCTLPPWPQVVGHIKSVKGVQEVALFSEKRAA